MAVLLEYLMLTALLEYFDLLTQVAESGPANPKMARLWAPALIGDKTSHSCHIFIAE